MILKMRHSQFAKRVHSQAIRRSEPPSGRDAERGAFIVVLDRHVLCRCVLAGKGAGAWATGVTASCWRDGWLRDRALLHGRSPSGPSGSRLPRAPKPPAEARSRLRDAVWFFGTHGVVLGPVRIFSCEVSSPGWGAARSPRLSPRRGVAAALWRRESGTARPCELARSRERNWSWSFVSPSAGERISKTSERRGSSTRGAGFPPPDSTTHPPGATYCRSLEQAACAWSLRDAGQERRCDREAVRWRGTARRW
jgi:hypothetical protein